MTSIKKVEIAKLGFELAWLSTGYFESCVFLCESVIEGKFVTDWGRDSSILFLCHHSLELLFKAGILAAGKEYKKNHDLAALESAFRACWPQYRFQMPAALAKLAIEPGLFPETEGEASRSSHERLRYVTRRDGKHWPETPELDHARLNEELGALRKALSPILIPLWYGNTLQR